ncbi:protein tyrosine kinase [Alkalilimnicola ehrlichii]|uniref:non-specific protein-tyrosine kinase n=1 Tax=Alkalilimnicola ehrlichii TaxID=351052 RepID=A0A3E0WXH2_9GAMM|nr:CpsD/CapB family tyrosine-protein kinase [Alkalilimnicola ehrlichii]RFA29349.1 protein tyrosine kinase [Alkalilimnicola ehrlichii]RFA36863.1 protein tyrosine kinase [Alkalilimnicola ehrlichii]
MERIKQALEKAKSQAAGSTTGWSGVSPGAFVAAESKASADTGDVSSLAYSHTRVVTLDPTHLEKHRVVAFNKNDPSTVAFDRLRTQVLQKMDEKAWRTLAITSPNEGAGKTVVAINLAISIARQTGKTAMLVDFDLRRPKIAKYLGFDAERSLNEVLAGQATVADALINPGIPRLVVLPTMRPEQLSAELLSSRVAESLIQELRNRYPDRIVIFDLPPLLNTDDALVALPQIDAALLIIGNGEVTEAELKDSYRCFTADRLLGTVLNKGEESANYY